MFMGSKKKMDYKTKVRILIGAIAVTVVILIFTIVHCFQVMKEAQDPYSPNARAAHNYQGPTQAEIDADDRFFKAREVAPLPIQPKPSPAQAAPAAPTKPAPAAKSTATPTSK
jgi:hypothetical protein